MLEFLVEGRRAIHVALSADIAAFATDRNWAALLAVLPIGVLFGAAHALTPGHSKVIEGKHGVGFAATRIGLQPQHRVAALAGQPLERRA